VSNARQLWCRLLFHCLLNHDGLNLRKVGFLYAGKELWRLAPACGLLPNLELTLNNGQRPTKGLWLDSTLDMLREDSGAFEIPRTQASLVLRRQLLAFQGWKVMARQFDVNMSDSDMALLEPVMHNSNIKRARELLDA
jgi:serine/threonine-protein kinase HipA